jgi:adenylate kinase
MVSSGSNWRSRTFITTLASSPAMRFLCLLIVLVVCCGSAESWLGSVSGHQRGPSPIPPQHQHPHTPRTRNSVYNVFLRYPQIVKTSHVKSLDASAPAAAALSPSLCAPKLIIAGAPAAGKGTQCEVLKAAFGVVHLSTGDILRKAVADGTPLGKKVKTFMDSGNLVPDELITDLVCNRLKMSDCCNKGWLLDGFPRTSFQADALKSHNIVPDCFILLDVPEAVLVERVIGRRVDPVTGNVYHLTSKPPPNDEAVLKRLVQRSDDTREKIVVRYQDFKRNIDAVKSRFQDKMVRFDGTAPQSQVSEGILKTVQDICKVKESSL